MSSHHPNVETVTTMTAAVLGQDHDALAKVFTDDLVFHLRGPHPMAGDHSGLGGFLGFLGSMFEATNGEIELDQQFCIGVNGWAAEWEHATLGRNGRTLESRNAFVYRFDRPRQDEPDDRAGPHHQREDRRQPRQPHLHEAQRDTIRRHRVRLRPRTRMTGSTFGRW